MNLQSTIALRCADVAPDWLEYRTGITVFPTTHPPSLKNPRKVLEPLPTDGWHKDDSPEQQKRAREDLQLIMRRMGRQTGKPVVVRTAMQNTQPI